MKISVSILSSRFKKNAIKKLNKTDCDYIHIDVMDGNFVPYKNLAFKEVEKLTKNNKKKLDIHLMTANLERNIKIFSTLNPYSITIHLENTNNIERLIELIKKLNIKCGISINPKTEIKEVFPYLKDVDFVLVMSVEPGKGSQEFIFNSLSKVKILKEEIKFTNPNVLISVDGGINALIAPQLEENGADQIVVGSFITKKKDFQKQIDKIKKPTNN